MNQNLWGPYVWSALHCITFGYPLKPTTKDKENYMRFFEALQPVLPCDYCRKNYARNLREKPIRLNSRRSLIYWLIDLHNEVNGKEGRRQYTYNEVVREYEKRLNKKIDLGDDNNFEDCSYHGWEYFKNIVIVSIIACIILYIILRMKKYI